MKTYIRRIDSTIGQHGPLVTPVVVVGTHARITLMTSLSHPNLNVVCSSRGKTDVKFGDIDSFWFLVEDVELQAIDRLNGILHGALKS